MCEKSDRSIVQLRESIPKTPCARLDKLKSRDHEEDKQLLDHSYHGSLNQLHLPADFLNKTTVDSADEPNIDVTLLETCSKAAFERLDAILLRTIALAHRQHDPANLSENSFQPLEPPSINEDNPEANASHTSGQSPLLPLEQSTAIRPRAMDPTTNGQSALFDGYQPLRLDASDYSLINTDLSELESATVSNHSMLHQPPLLIELELCKTEVLQLRSTVDQMKVALESATRKAAGFEQQCVELQSRLDAKDHSRAEAALAAINLNGQQTQAQDQNIPMSNGQDYREKYTDLKALAYELRDKLSNRTAALERNMRENERLRSVLNEQEVRCRDALRNADKVRQEVSMASQDNERLTKENQRLKRILEKGNLEFGRVSAEKKVSVVSAQRRVTFNCKGSTDTESAVVHACDILVKAQRTMKEDKGQDIIQDIERLVSEALKKLSYSTKHLECRNLELQ